MNRVSVTIRTAAALVLATLVASALPVNAEEDGKTTTTVTESGSSGGRTYRRQTTITRSSSSSRNRSSSGAGKNSSSAKKKAPFKAGDDVLLERAGDIVAGKVVGVDRSSGWVQVKCDDDGGTKQTVPPGHLTPAVRKGKKLLTSGPGLKGEFEVGDEVLVGFGGVHIAEVLEIGGNGWVKVKFENDGIEMTPTLPPSKLRLIESTSDPVLLAEGAALRDWSSQGGKFTINAKFVELRGDSVTLKKEDGKSLTVAIDKLSDDDQDLARQLAEAAEGDSVAGNAGKE